ncbi:probable polygalacturonase At3g15720 [Humulus lupulus]|uniref:probable polygalacturonase At3g15720 n=1 Tax=Humulus lupulus TaxID=3486 RepID=UPI002B412AA6|nr:probable polygalacturonase At3g15720 [Humulus lupulus]
MEFGATGNGTNDDSQDVLNDNNGVLRAWKNVCGSKAGRPVLKFPAGRTYLLKPMLFQGPCVSNSVLIQIDGYIRAPSSIYEWIGFERGSWLHFLNINGLIVSGKGTFDGYGHIWWNITKKGGSIKAPAGINQSCSPMHVYREVGQQPTNVATLQAVDQSCSPMHVNREGLGFHHCNNLQLYGFTSKNSPNKHITIQGCIGVTVSNIHIQAPKTSPNTDGIMISTSSQININESFIATGDDCISIKSGSSYINITHIACGPGHGISVGSLGVVQTPSTVEQVHVKNCTFNGTSNGARIKTWSTGVGYARAITFEHITLIASQNPIIINQDYTDLKDGAIKISDVTYRGFVGTSLTEEAITLDCAKLGCNGIVMEKINLVSALPGKKVTSFCKNANGKLKSTSPNVPCLAKES